MKRLAILLPWFSFFLREQYLKGYICLALQISVIGWPLASLWALITLLTGGSQHKNSAILQSLHPTYYSKDMTTVKNIA